MRTMRYYVGGRAVNHKMWVLVIMMDETDQLRVDIATHVAMADDLTAADVRLAADILGVRGRALQSSAEQDHDIARLARPYSSWSETALRGIGLQRGGLLLLFSEGGTCITVAGRNAQPGFLGIGVDDLAEVIDWPAAAGLFEGALRYAGRHEARDAAGVWYGHASRTSDGSVLLALCHLEMG